MKVIDIAKANRTHIGMPCDVCARPIVLGERCFRWKSAGKFWIRCAGANCIGKSFLKTGPTRLEKELQRKGCL